jgi:hypothetical protein
MSKEKVSLVRISYALIGTAVLENVTSIVLNAVTVILGKGTVMAVTYPPTLETKIDRIVEASAAFMIDDEL